MEPRWLDEREERAWRGFQEMRINMTALLARRLTRKCGLSEADYSVLLHVSEAPGHRIRSRDLCRILQWDRSRLSRQITRMESRGTITRASCDDARGFDVVLTESGLAAVRVASRIQLEAVRHCFADLLTSEQLETLGDITELVTKHLATEHDEVPAD
ncbi:MarR family winged helix-turn-helix transcriptional regulator [Streptomyces sp. NPDC057253]|uniref:MarR family winged helix-turn-helix transcriptional regulator n=1 Tax=Streptomyces sp. NPDC057253 TaxID=3346069 RepID=UPI003636D6DB